MTSTLHALDHTARIVAILRSGRAAKELDAVQHEHRAATLASVAPGKLTAADALASIDAVRTLDRVAYHAWRASAHLFGRGARDDNRMP